MDFKLTNNIKSIFETPLYETEIENISEVQKELLDTIKDIKFDTHPTWGNTIHLSDPTFRTDIIKSKFKEELHRHVEPYSMQSPFFGCSYKIRNSWFTLMKKHGYSHIHNHGTNDISGVYYVQTSSEDGNIFFESSNQWHSNRINIKPEVGKLLLFPSWLSHGVTTNTTDYPRISLSFNLVFDRF